MSQELNTLILNACDSNKNWVGILDCGNTASGGDMEDFVVNTTGQYEGTGCLNVSLNFGVDSGAGNVGQLYNDILGTKDISIYQDAFFNLFISNANLTSIVSAEARIGTNSSNYAYWSLTNAQLTGFTNPVNSNWREIQLLNISGATTSGTVDLTNINYLSLLFTHNGSAVINDGNLRLDYWRATKTLDFISDIELDGQGYMLLQEDNSYLREDQPYTIDRFAQGDITYSDFDIYQYDIQTDWSGGWNDEQGLNVNTFWDGYGLDHSKVGQITANFSAVFVTTAANTGVVTSIQEYNNTGFIGISAGAGSAHIYSWIGAGNTLTSQQSAAKSAVIDQIVFQNDLWVSLGSVHQGNNSMLNYDGTTWSAVAQSGTYFGELGQTLYTMDTNSNMRSFDGTTWTTEFTQSGWYGHRMVAWRDKLWYLASSPLFQPYTQTKCALFSYDGVDLLMVQEFEEWCTNSIAVLDNKLWFVVGGKLVSYDGEVIKYEMDITDRYEKKFALDIYTSTLTNTAYEGLGKGFQNINDKLYVVQNSASATVSQLLMNSGVGWAPSVFNGSAQGQVSTLGMLNIRNEKNLLIGNTLGKLFFCRAYGAQAPIAALRIESSWRDQDLFSVDKLYRSIQIFYKTLDLDSFLEATVKYKIDNDDNTFQTIGNITTNDVGTSFIEFNLPTNTYGKRIKYEITWGGNQNPTNTKTLIITSIGIKYLIVPDTKRKWNMRVMLPNNVLYNNGLRDTNSGKELADVLWTSRLKKRTIPFKDIDNEIYNVIINDVKIQGPYNVQVGRDSIGTNPEYIAAIELLEG